MFTQNLFSLFVHQNLIFLTKNLIIGQSLEYWGTLEKRQR